MGAVAKAAVTKRDLVERVTQGGTLGYGDAAPLRSNTALQVGQGNNQATLGAAGLRALGSFAETFK